MLASPKEYINLQLACGLAVEIWHKPDESDPNTIERLKQDEEWVELNQRGKSDQEVIKVRTILQQIKNWMKPIVCMAEDDIELGLEMGVSCGIVTPERHKEMVAILVQFAQQKPKNNFEAEQAV